MACVPATLNRERSLDTGRGKDLDELVAEACEVTGVVAAVGRAPLK